MSISARFSGVEFSIVRAFSPRARLCAAISGLSLTKQSFRDECDVNQIISRFTRTGILPEGRGTPRFGDAVAPDFQDALNTVIAGEQAFNSLSAAVRKRFDNSAVAVLEFLQDPNNRDEAIKLGLIEPPAAPVGVEVSSPPSGAAGGAAAGVSS